MQKRKKYVRGILVLMVGVPLARIEEHIALIASEKKVAKGENTFGLYN
jgi:hypothetical protein